MNVHFELMKRIKRKKNFSFYSTYPYDKINICRELSGRQEKTVNTVGLIRNLEKWEGNSWCFIYLKYRCINLNVSFPNKLIYKQKKRFKCSVDSKCQNIGVTIYIASNIVIRYY